MADQEQDEQLAQRLIQACLNASPFGLGKKVILGPPMTYYYPGPQRQFDILFAATGGDRVFSSAQVIRLKDGDFLVTFWNHNRPTHHFTCAVQDDQVNIVTSRRLIRT